MITVLHFNKVLNSSVVMFGRIMEKSPSRFACFCESAIRRKNSGVAVYKIKQTVTNTPVNNEIASLRFSEGEVLKTGIVGTATITTAADS